MTRRPRGSSIGLLAAACGALTCGALACSSSEAPVDAGLDGALDAPRDVAAVPDARRDAPSPGDGGTPTDAGPPTLISLSVSGESDGSSALTLEPAFDPAVFDYYVRCAAGPNPVTVTMQASPGALSSLMQPTTSPSRPAQTLTVSVNENHALVAAAARGAEVTQYWVRCLPPDFPQLKMNRHPEAGTPTAGYYLVGAFGPANGAAYAMVLDGNGVPVWYYLVASTGVGDIDTLLKGVISFAPALVHYGFFQLDPEGLSTAAPAGTIYDRHEVRVLPSGHLLAIATPVKTGVDLTGVKIHLADGGSETFGKNSSILDCEVVEFDLTSGTIYWKWTATDHLDPLKDTTLWQLAPPDVAGPDSGTLVDAFHCNSIDVDPANGDLLVSARDTDSVFYIDRKSGKILWKLGGLSFTRDDAIFFTVADPFYRQHDARLQPGWSAGCNGGTGQISVFDDESYRDAEARGVVYDIVVQDGGKSACDGGSLEGGVPGAVAWQYKGTQASGGLGSFRITADGSRVIDWGNGAKNLVFTEVDVHGNDLLDFEFTDGNVSYRAIKVPLTALDLGAMRNTAGASSL